MWVYDSYYNEFTYECALLAAGGCIQAADLVCEGKSKTAFAVVRPPGKTNKIFKL